MIYPRVVFKNHGPHQRHGGSFDQKIVADEGEMMDAINDGWFASLPEAIKGEHDELVIANDAAPTRAEMEEKAKELGIKFDGRTSDAKLIEKIEEALSQENEE